MNDSELELMDEIVRNEFKNKLMQLLGEYKAELYSTPNNGIGVELSEIKSGEEITQNYQSFLIGHTFTYYG